MGQGCLQWALIGTCAASDLTCDAWGPLAGEMPRPVQGAQASGAPRGQVGLGSLREAPALWTLLCRSHGLGLGLASEVTAPSCGLDVG